MNNSYLTNRRKFIKGSAAAGALSLAPSSIRAANKASNTVIRANGTEEEQNTFFVAELADGDALRSIDNGGGGYGDPREREMERVLHDVREGYISAEAARDVYGIAITGSVDDETLAVDKTATAELRD